ncbi:MAG TPA: hypothetical protein VG407_15095 [Caulobacteraceae bacterium]|jgi:hypothetical protein|nr:hypothetical protein [Caulobacteraceae bacterium]
MLIDLIAAIVMAALSGFWLMRGFATKRMYCFFSLALNGAAPLKGNPAWFWAYGAFNLVTFVLSVMVVLIVVSRPGGL